MTTDGEKTSVRYKVRFNLLNVKKITLAIQSGKNPIVFSSFDTMYLRILNTIWGHDTGGKQSTV